MSIAGKATDDASQLLIGRGKMFFNRLVSGVGVGSRYLGNGELWEASTTDDTKEKYSSSEASSGLLDSTNIRRTLEGSLSLDEFSQENLAIAFMGTAAADVQSAGDVVAESHASVAQGAWYDLGNGTVRAVSTVVVKVSSTVKTENTDYIVDYDAGRIFIVPGGGIADAATITVDYHKAAHTGFSIATGVANKIEGELLFVGDPAKGPPLRIRIWKVQFAPDGALGVISDDYGVIKLKWKAVKDSANHASEPWAHVDVIPQT